MKTRSILSIVLFLLSQTIAAQEKPALQNVDRVRLAEAFRLADNLSEKVWKDWTKAPFAVLLVTPEYEFLMRHPSPSADFLPLGYDSRLKADLSYRKRVFSPSFLATFPAIKGSMVPTIVVGRAEQTSAKTSTPWIVVLLHEHFHQLQDSQPNYYTDVEALNLSHGDRTGMWMLNFAFPYDRKEVQDRFHVLSGLLTEAVQASPRQRKQNVNAYLRARTEFTQMLTAEEARYLEFQFWQEGVARYTEYQIAKLASKKFKPSKQYAALPDYTSFAQSADSLYSNIFKQLKTQKLEVSRRDVVYPFGAAEALLLDQANPKWKRHYFVDRFDLNKFYPR
jgi:hypothetical protein